MRKSVKVALATSALAVAGGLFLVGSSFADRGSGPMGHMGPMRMMGFGPVAHDALDRPRVGLSRPPAEARPVVLERELQNPAFHRGESRSNL